MSQGFAERLSNAWYQKALWPWLFWPLSLLFGFVLFVRSLFKSSPAPSSVPVIVVGNITAGGTGKSPLVSHLVRFFEAKGFRVGVVSRGYGVAIPYSEVRVVRMDSKASEVGDEPLMLKQLLGCDIALSPDRQKAVDYLVSAGVELVISDDGLQHHKMHRDIELCVIDGKRGLGNGQLLPVGPLREPVSRLAKVDAIVCNGALEADSKLLFGASDSVFRTHMQLVPKLFVRLDGSESMDAVSFVERYASERFSAIAAIGNPQRFFDTLRTLGLRCEGYSYPDHYAYRQADLDEKTTAILMTEKDAAKCKDLHCENAWFLRVEPELQDNLGERLYNQLNEMGRLVRLKN
jgi:tetraacyldisaccharide 4'-kinase